MTYCISDIHGHYDTFMSLLEKIDFNPSDTLYMLGDAVDRGPDSIKCLQYIMGQENIHMLMGNHERMMLDVLLQSNDCWEYQLEVLWLEYNGGYQTYTQYQALPEDEQVACLNYLKGLPYYQTVTMHGQTFFLVHAGLNLKGWEPNEPLSDTIQRQQTHHPNDMVWIREAFFRGPELPGYVIIFGHTPGQSIPGHRRNTIWHSKGKIGIDCGCYKGGQLAALCLDDMREYYVPQISRSNPIDIFESLFAFDSMDEQ